MWKYSLLMFWVQGTSDPFITDVLGTGYKWSSAPYEGAVRAVTLVALCWFKRLSWAKAAVCPLPQLTKNIPGPQPNHFLPTELDASLHRIQSTGSTFFPLNYPQIELYLSLSFLRWSICSSHLCVMQLSDRTRKRDWKECNVQCTCDACVAASTFLGENRLAARRGGLAHPG